MNDDVNPPLSAGEWLRRGMILLLVGGVLAYLAWRLLFTLNAEYPVASGMFFVADLITAISTLGFALSLYSLRPAPLAPPPRPGLRVDVWIPTYNESAELLERTIYHCVMLDYPHQTYVLDDGNREEIKQLAERLGARYVCRVHNRHAKAGNLNNALSQSNGDFIAIFDADFIPQRDFLTRLLGHFTCPKLALVQTPQHYYNLSSFQYRIHKRVWHEQQSFLSQVLPGRNHFNAAFWIGTNAILRREAIESIGGFATDSLIEDMLTTLHLHASGWRTRYVDLPLAFGLAPSNLTHFLSQRLRWSQGAAQILRSNNPLWMRGLTPIQRILYLSSLLHFFEGSARLVYYAMPALFLLSGISPLRSGEDTLGILLGFMAFQLVALAVISKGKVTPWYDELFAAVRTLTYFTGNLSLLLKRPLRFVVTPKDENGRVPLSFLAGPILILALNLGALLTRGNLLYYALFGERVSLTFLISCLFCAGFSLSALQALRLCLTHSGIPNPQIFETLTATRRTDSGEDAGHNFLLRSWNLQAATLVGHQALQTGEKLRLALALEKGEIVGLETRVERCKSLAAHANGPLFEYAVAFESLEEPVRRRLLDRLFQRGVLQQQQGVETLAQARDFPLKVDGPRSATTLGRWTSRGILQLRWPGALPSGTRLQVGLPGKTTQVLEVTRCQAGEGSFLLEGRIEESTTRLSLKHNPTRTLLPLRRQRTGAWALISTLSLAASYGMSSQLLSGSLRIQALDAGYAEASGPPSSDVVQRYGHLSVRGTQLLGENNQPVQLRGISSHGIQWYPLDRRSLRNTVRSLNVDVVRIAMYVEGFKNGEFWNGYVAQPMAMQAQVDRLIQAAVDEGIYVILSWHIHSDPRLYQGPAREFFRALSARWGHTPNLILEIANEPEGNIDWSAIRAYAVGDSSDPADGVIDVIRQADSDAHPNVVIVGTPFWSQHVHLALEQPIIEHKNVMYTLHFYAAEHKEETRRNAQLALDGGLPIFVTEWGTCNYSVDGPVDLESSTAWVNWMNTHGISWVNWSLSNKDESSSLLLPSAPLSGPWTVEDFSASGRYVRSLLLTTPGGTERRASAGRE